MTRKRKDPVTRELYLEVLKRDGYSCVAALIAHERGWAIDPCRDRWGEFAQSITGSYRIEALTLDHIQSDYGRMGKRAESDAGHLVTICYHHHLNGWATAHRPELRAYLAGPTRTNGGTG